MESNGTLKILESIGFSRKKPPSAAQKKAYAELQRSVNTARQRLNKLHLRLWQAVSSRDYHSVSLEEAKKALGDIARELDAVSKTLSE